MELETILLAKTQEDEDGSEDFGGAFGDGIAMPSSPSPEEEIGVGDLGEEGGETANPDVPAMPEEEEGGENEW